MGSTGKTNNTLLKALKGLTLDAQTFKKLMD